MSSNTPPLWLTKHIKNSISNPAADDRLPPRSECVVSHPRRHMLSWFRRCSCSPRAINPAAMIFPPLDDDYNTNREWVGGCHHTHHQNKTHTLNHLSFHPVPRDFPPPPPTTDYRSWDENQPDLMAGLPNIFKLPFAKSSFKKYKPC